MSRFRHLARMLRPALLLALLACVRPVSAAEPAAAMDTGRLVDFRLEAEAHNEQDPLANPYRAGYYNGYLAGVLDSLQGRRICFRDCICELDKLVAGHLAAHPEARGRSVADWLVPLLEARYPCT